MEDPGDQCRYFFLNISDNYPSICRIENTRYADQKINQTKDIYYIIVYAVYSVLIKIKAFNLNTNGKCTLLKLCSEKEERMLKFNQTLGP